MGLTCDEITNLVARDTVDKAKAWDAISEKNSEIARLKAELARRTTERDYHKRIADKLADVISSIEDAAP